jgi:hypothetical protein
MPKLPANYVKAPSFDNPLRSTSVEVANAAYKLVLRMDADTRDQLLAECKREGITPEALVLRALERWLNPIAIAPRTTDAPTPSPRQSLRAQLFERLNERLMQRTWVQRLLTMREILREIRA